MYSALVAVGSNLGDRGKLIERATRLLEAEVDFSDLVVSTLIESEPIGGSSDAPSYLNGAIKFQTNLSAEEVHQRLLQVEVALGRERYQRWASREIDLDLVGFANQIVQSETLIVPHPRMSFRPFVIDPLNELSPDWVHPQIGRSIAELSDQLKKGTDQIGVSREILPLVLMELNNYQPQVALDAVPVEMAYQPKLSILLSNVYSEVGPRLVLPESNLDSWRKDVRAAIEAVWPAV